MEENKLFHGLRICSQNILLPEDFNSFFEYIIPSVRKCQTIGVTISDVINVLNLDVEREVCRDGHLKIWEACGTGDISIFDPFFRMLDTYKNCLVFMSGNFSLVDTTMMTLSLQEKTDDDANFCIALGIEEEISNYKEVKVILNIM